MPRKPALSLHSLLNATLHLAIDNTTYWVSRQSPEDSMQAHSQQMAR